MCALAGTGERARADRIPTRFRTGRQGDALFCPRGLSNSDVATRRDSLVLLTARASSNHVSFNNNRRRESRTYDSDPPSFLSLSFFLFSSSYLRNYFAPYRDSEIRVEDRNPVANRALEIETSTRISGRLSLVNFHFRSEQRVNTSLIGFNRPMHNLALT